MSDRTCTITENRAKQRCVSRNAADAKTSTPPGCGGAALGTLQLEIEERSGGSSVAEPKHMRRVVVEHAPALFLIPCGDSRCKDGGHDITHMVLRSLRAGEAEFQGEDVCAGSQGSGQCSRILHYVATATYA